MHKRNKSPVLYLRSFAVFAVTAAVGVLLVHFGHAAYFTTSTEAESGTLVGQLSAQPGAGASGSGSIRFGSGQKASFGILGTDPSYRIADMNAGVTTFDFDIAWSLWEPTQGAYNTTYIEQVKAAIQSYVNAGATVIVSPGYQIPPAWVSQLPDGALKDQNGRIASVAPNYAFSAAVQSAMATYTGNLVKTLGNSVSQYRLGAGTTGEIIYPDASSNAPNTWWIGSASGALPAGGTANPMPGWVPGTTSWNGQNVTVAMATNWYTWYIRALQNSLVAQASAFRNARFNGPLAIVTPGIGSVPPFYQSRVDKLLADTGSDPYGTMNTGAVFQSTIPYLASRISPPLVVDATGAGDGTGDADQQNCQPNDGAVDISTTSNAMVNWSSTRWVHSLAVKSGLPFIIESGAQNSPIATVFSQLQSCNASALLWLNDAGLHGGGSNVSLAQYADYIAKNK